MRAIVEAAETSAAEIQREAETEAREIREEADSEAQATREQATEQAREYVGKVSESTEHDAAAPRRHGERAGALIESLRTGANRLDCRPRLLESGLGEVGEAVDAAARFEPEAAGAERRRRSPRRAPSRVIVRGGRMPRPRTSPPADEAPSPRGERRRQGVRGGAPRVPTTPRARG